MTDLRQYLGQVQAAYPDAIFEGGNILFTDEGFDITLRATELSIGVTLFLFNFRGDFKQLNSTGATSTLLDPNGDVSLYMLIGASFSAKELTDAVNTLKAKAKELLIDHVVEKAWL